MITTLIIDDEPQNNRILRHFIETYCKDIKVLGEATTIENAMQMIRDQQPQLVFLDIELPGQNAFDLINQLMPVNFEIIFVTAYKEYAINAIKYNALDYLLKPVSIEELQEAVDKARTRILKKDINDRLSNLLYNQVHTNENSKIALPTQDGLAFYPIREIVHCDADGPYTRFHFMQIKSLLVTGTLKEFEELLPREMFFRVHHSYLVNLQRIKKYYKGKGGYLEMDNGDVLAP